MSRIVNFSAKVTTQLGNNLDNSVSHRKFANLQVLTTFWGSETIPKVVSLPLGETLLDNVAPVGHTLQVKDKSFGRDWTGMRLT